MTHHPYVPPKWGEGGLGAPWGMRTKLEKVPALGASAYLLVCRRHAALLALRHTHSGRGGAGGVRVALTVARCPSAAAAQHVTPLDHIAARCAPVGACPVHRPVGGAPRGHHRGPAPRRTCGLGHKHGDAPRCASGDGDGDGRAGGGGL